MYNVKPSSNVENFAILTHLNTEELRSVLNDEAKLEEMVKDVQQLQDIEKEKEMMLVSNRSLAEYNLNKEPLLIISKNKVVELSEICDNLYKSIEEKYNETSSKGGQNNLETKLSLLQTATQEMEEESESIVESFLDGSIELDEFLDRFMQRRKIMHLRKVKAEKMKEILHEHLNYNRGDIPPPYPSGQFYRPRNVNMNGAMWPHY